MQSQQLPPSRQPTCSGLQPSLRQRLVSGRLHLLEAAFLYLNTLRLFVPAAPQHMSHSRDKYDPCHLTAQQLHLCGVLWQNHVAPMGM